MASQSSSFSFNYEYDVFLSFRGSDTRYGFTGYLYKALDDKGINTFIDDEQLQRGHEITPSLKKAIQESRIVIIVLSTNYAESSFCLDELTTILHCANTKGLLVLPVFYDVDPSDVRHHKGSYGEALARHEEKFKAKKESFNHNMERLKKWKEALHHVANLSGYHFKQGDGYERDFIGKIVKFVSTKINLTHPLHVADYHVGLESQVLEVKKLLDVGSDVGVLMIGIHGIGGIGKSTLARAVYNLVAYNFEGFCFLDNIREKSNKDGLAHLQSTLLSKITGEQKIGVQNWEQGIPMIKHRLQRKKVLLILDDVDQHKQLQAIVGEPDWLGHGSRVIITTRDKQLLTSHGVERIYEVEELYKDDAIQLLKWHAFKTKKFDPRYWEVLNQVVNYASGLPLALEVIGCNLFGKSKEEWKSACDQYKKIPNSQILKILKVSFDGLEEQEKNVFLDIACFFKGHYLTKVEDILRAHYGDCMKYHISVLVQKSLIKLSWCDTYCTVELHDLIEDMGKEIVRQESPQEPGNRSRLWLREDIIKVLEDNTGTSKIEIICLNFFRFDKEIVEWNGEAFKEMKNLKTLVIRNGNFSKDPKYLPNSLRVLEWRRYPSQCLPYDFHPKELSICKLTDSCLTSFMLDGLSKEFLNLKVLKFDRGKCLTQISDVSSLPNLEELSFEYCENLISVHDSVGFLDKLKILSANRCTKLRSFPPLKLTSLEKLDLSFCSSLERFPEILGKMRNIRKLELLGTSIKELSFSIKNLIGLQELSIRQRGIVQLPSSIVMMSELTKIEAYLLEGLQWIKQEEGEEEVDSIVSSKIEEIWAKDINLYDDFFSIGFRLFAHVKILDLSNNNFTILPEFIKECQFLRKLGVSGCKYLQEIRGIPPSLKLFSACNCESLTSANASVLLNQKLHEAGNTVYILPRGVWIPEWFDHHRRGPSISFWFRKKFPHKILCLVIAPLHHIIRISPKVFVNGYLRFDGFGFGMGDGHTCLFDLRYTIFKHSSPDEEHFENEWNHVEITYLVYEYFSFPPEFRIHIFEQESCMDDVRFTDPYSKRKILNHKTTSW